MTQNGLYIIKDEFFKRFPNSHWVDNKNEKPPFFFAIKDQNGLLWMIPLSSQVDNIKAKIAREEAKRGKGNCIYYHIGQVAGRERGFNIGNMFPITENYILRSWTIGGKPYIVQETNVVEAITRKSLKFLNLVDSGTIRPQVDIMAIMRILTEDK